jgi:glycosyltransferase involved in cell wall biosynthesis
MDKKNLYIDALVLAEEHMSGIGHLTLGLVRALAVLPGFVQKYNIYLVVPMGKIDKVLRHEIPNVQIKTIPMPARIISLLNNNKLLPPLDIFLGKGIYLFPNYRNWPLNNSKSITYIHDASFALYPETVQPRNLKYLKNNINLWVKRADLIVTLTQASKADIATSLAIDSKKIHVVGCGVDGSVFKKTPKAAVEATKRKYGIHTPKYLLFVGNLEPRKNLSRLIKAYSGLDESLLEQYPLVVIGAGGWLNDGTNALIQESAHNGVKIIKPSQFVLDEDLPAIYSGASAYIHPAIYEGFGIPPIEAMSCGTVTIVSDIPVLNEVLGSAALKFDPYNISDITCKIQSILTRPSDKKQYIEKGNILAKKYTWQNAAEKLAYLITSTQ